MLKKLLFIIVCMILVLNWASPALAQEDDDGNPGQITLGSDLILEEDDVVVGDVVVVGGNLEMKEDSRVMGGVAIFDGDADINGTVVGDVVVFGGNVALLEDAQITGDVTSIGGKVEVDEDARVTGKVLETTVLSLGGVSPPSSIVDVMPPNRIPGISIFEGAFRVARALLLSLVLAVIGLLVLMFLPEHSRTVAQTIKTAAPASVGVGLLTMLVGLTVMTLLAVTICLAPVSLLLLFALAIALLFGWIVAGYMLGCLLLPSLQSNKSQVSPTLAALVGVFVITGLNQGLIVMGGLPCMGFAFWVLGAGVWLVIASLGLGSVVLTRFGTQSYPPPPSGTIPPALPPVPTRPTTDESQIEAEPGPDIVAESKIVPDAGAPGEPEKPANTGDEAQEVSQDISEDSQDDSTKLD